MPEELTPAQTEAVRRALRAARHEAPLPDEVAARLDDRLAELVAASVPTASAASSPAPSASGGGDPDVDDHGGATVVPLASRRHRRRTTLLVAAAAVTVLGVGTTQLLHQGADDASLTADRGNPAAATGADGRSSLPEAPTAGDVPEASALDSALPLPVRLTSGQRAALVAAGYHDLRRDLTLAETKALDSTATSSRSGAAYALAGCGADLPDDLPPTTAVYSARHDGRRVVLVVLPGPEVSAYPCAGGAPTVVPLD